MIRGAHSIAHSPYLEPLPRKEGNYAPLMPRTDFGPEVGSLDRILVEASSSGTCIGHVGFICSVNEKEQANIAVYELLFFENPIQEL